MKVIVSPDSYKGTMTATEAADAIAMGVRCVFPKADVVKLPVGDGGEGTMEAILSSDGIQTSGVFQRECITVDPLRRPLHARYAVFTMNGKETALIESAAASGITLVIPKDRDIMNSDTFGTGILIADAYRRGVRRFLICMGGTATCDGGLGAYKAMKGIIGTDAFFTLLCDVENPLCGPQGAASVFGPQKGATARQISLLDHRLRELAQEYSEESGIDVTNMKFAGAAGGMAGMLMACFGALPVSGIRKVLELLNFDLHLEGADLVITGEGRVDATTCSGKAPMGILESARRRGVPTAVIGGSVADREKLISAGFRHILQATPDDTDPSISPVRFLTDATINLMERFR